MLVSGGLKPTVAYALTKVPTACGELVAKPAVSCPKQLGGLDGAADAGDAIPTARAPAAATMSVNRFKEITSFLSPGRGL